MLMETIEVHRKGLPNRKARTALGGNQSLLISSLRTGDHMASRLAISIGVVARDYLGHEFCQYDLKLTLQIFFSGVAQRIPFLDEQSGAYHARCDCKTHEDFRAVNQTVAILYLNQPIPCMLSSHVTALTLPTFRSSQP